MLIMSAHRWGDWVTVAFSCPSLLALFVLLLALCLADIFASQPCCVVPAWRDWVLLFAINDMLNESSRLTLV